MTRSAPPLRARLGGAFLAAACAFAVPLAAPAPAAAQSEAVKLKASGAWMLGMRRQARGVAGCFAGTANQVRQVFEYQHYNAGLSVFRLSSPEFFAMENQTEVKFALRVDKGKTYGLGGRVFNGAAILPIDDKAQQKRDFVRAMAAGKTLSVYDENGSVFAQFSLRGARDVLVAFGPCRARLPKLPKDFKLKKEAEE